MPEPHSRLPAADLTHGTRGSDVDFSDSIAGKDYLIEQKGCCGTFWLAFFRLHLGFDME
jgi:hypothetical protein